MDLFAEARKALKETFGFDDFRPAQKRVLGQVLAHKDTLALMPTGGGKSLCYQIPALIFPGTAVVICSGRARLTPPERDALRAFLFSCFTGLRFSDLRSLSPEEIEEGKMR